MVKCRRNPRNHGLRLIVFLFLSCCAARGFPEEIATELSPSPPRVIVEQFADRERIYPQQPFEITMNLYVINLPGNSLELDSLTRGRPILGRGVPLVFIPWADDRMIPTGVRALDIRDPWIRSLRKGESGFSLNGLQQEGVIVRRIIFSPKAEKVFRKESGGEEQAYWKYSIARRFVAERAGEFRFAPIEVDGTFIAHDENSRLIGEKASVISEPLRVRVFAVPRENRPENDVGLSGVFQWNVDLVPRKAKVGEPLTLSLRIFGTGSILEAKAPDLSRDSRISELFKTYPATEQVLENECRYVYTIRPKKSGRFDFPPLHYSYFNVETERYESLQSDPIAVEIEEPPREKTATTQSRTGSRREARTGELELHRSGIFANMEDPAGAKNQRVNSTRYFAIFLGLFLVYAISAFLAYFLRLYRNNPRTREPRQIAISQARSQMRKALELLEEKKYFESCVQIQNAFTNFVAQIAGTQPQGLTPRDLVEILQRGSRNTEKIEEIQKYLESLDAVRYGTLTTKNAAGLSRKGEEVFEELIRLLPDSRKKEDEKLKTEIRKGIVLPKPEQRK